jgi:thioester reductase-like protein
MGNGVCLFTGFPGFIGARLLPRLLELHKKATFQCLVQKRFLDAAHASVRQIEKAHPHTRGRIDLVVGDITEKGLGIDKADARALQSKLVGAYHLAAVYDLTVAAELGHKINVLGTRHVLEFLGHAKHFERLHYVSTAYVSGRATGVFRETDLECGQGFKNHYEATKYQAEVDVVKSGLPQTIYRPAIVVGDSRTGETAKFDGPYFTIGAMEKMPSPGMFLRIGSGTNPANLVPVDFIVEALSLLSASPKSLGKTYNLTDPDPLTTYEVGSLFAKALGKSFLFVPVPLAVAKIMVSGPISAYLGMPPQTLDYFDHACRYDASQATADLAALGLRCPRLPDYVDNLIRFYRAKKSEVGHQAMV